MQSLRKSTAMALALCVSGAHAADEKSVKSQLGYEAVSVAPAKPEDGAMDTVIKKDDKEVARVTHAKPVSFSTDGKILLLNEAATDDDCRHFQLDVASGEKAKPFGQRHRIGGRYVEKTEWSKDGKTLTFTYHANLSGKPAETLTVAGHLNQAPAKPCIQVSRCSMFEVRI